MLKKILLAVAVALPMFCASAQTLKIGVVDTSSIMQAMPETTEAQKKLEETQKKYQDEGTRLETEFKRLLDEYQNMSDSEPAAIKERKTRELSDYQQKLQNFEQSASQDLQRVQQELMSPIVQKIRTAIESVGRENNFSLIEQTEMPLYFAAPVEDVTPLVKAKLGVK